MDPFKPFKDNVDLNKHQAIICKGIKGIIDFLKRYNKILDFIEIKKIFFKILEGKEDYNNNAPNHRIAYLAS